MKGASKGKSIAAWPLTATTAGPDVAAAGNATKEAVGRPPRVIRATPRVGLECPLLTAENNGSALPTTTARPFDAGSSNAF